MHSLVCRAAPRCVCSTANGCYWNKVSVLNKEASTVRLLCFCDAEKCLRTQIKFKDITLLRLQHHGIRNVWKHIHWRKRWFRAGSQAVAHVGASGHLVLRFSTSVMLAEFPKWLQWAKWLLICIYTHTPALHAVMRNNKVIC